ncbi:MAG: hypothetical protein ACP5KA_07655, partial [Desulfurococcaceae archaeon]
MSSEFAGFILFRGDRAYFKRGALGANDIGKLKVTKSDLLDAVKQLDALGKVKETKSGLWVYDEDLYKRLLVFSALYGPLRAKSPLKALKLALVVRRMDGYTIHFWYTEALEKYRRGGIRA